MSSTMKLLCVLTILLVILVTTLEAAPLAQTEDEFFSVVEQIRRVSAEIGDTKVDVYDHLVSSIPQHDRLKISRKVLRKLLHIKDKMLLRFRYDQYLKCFANL